MREITAILVFKNCSIYTVDKNRTWAQAFAIAGDQIIYVGDNEGVDIYIWSETVVVDLEDSLQITLGKNKCRTKT